MPYSEDLPPQPQCPPPDATDDALGVVWRLVPALPVEEAHFLSHAALKGFEKKPVKVSDCEWSSCSLRTTEDAIKDLGKLAGMKGRIRVSLNIPAGAGMAVVRGFHVDFWRYKTFDILASVKVTS